MTFDVSSARRVSSNMPLRTTPQ